MATRASDIVIAVLIGTTLLTTAAGNQIDDFQAVVSSYEKWRLENSPEFARTDGRSGYDDKVTDYSINVIEERHTFVNDLLTKMSSIDPQGLLKQDRLNFKILKSTLELYQDGYEWRNYGGMTPLNNNEGIWANKEYYIPKNPTTYKEFDSFIKRIDGYGNQTLDFIERMKQAIRLGTTNNWVSMANVPTSIDDLMGSTDESCIMYRPFNKSLDQATISSAEKAALRKRALSAIDAFRNKYRQLKDFIEKQYQPKSRQSYGVRSLPNGTEYYRACLRWHLTTDITPEEVHKTGLAEVDRILNEMKTVMNRQKFTGSVQEYFTSLADDSRFKLNTSDDVLEAYKQIVEERVWPRLHTIFRDIPNLPVTVRPMSYDGFMGTFSESDAGDSSNGFFNVNVYRPSDSPTYIMMALSLHEADPGHHLQSIYSNGAKDVADFRKLIMYDDLFSIPLNFPFFTAFMEGWGLYAESLGEKEYLNVYKDDYELMGRYSFEIWRACRLVVDTGIHYYNWSRDDAIEYILNHTSLTRDVVTIEVDRYITWPGQACAYKIGEMKIKELRQKAKSQLGAAFDIKDFHYLLLSNGPLPLTILEETVQDWIDAKQDTLEKIMVDYSNWRNEMAPEFSTSSSYKHNDQVDIYTLNQLDTLWAGANEFLERLHRIGRTQIKDYSKQLSYDVLENMLDTFISGYAWKDYGALNPIHFLSGLQTDPSGAWSSMPLDTQGDFVNYVRRLEQTPKQMDQMMNLTRVAIYLGHASNNVSLSRIPDEIDRVLNKSKPEESDLYKPFTDYAEKLFPEKENRDLIQSRLKTAITATLDKLREMKTFVENEYMPNSRPGLGVGTLPRGADLYKAALKWHTDLDITPEEVHVTGKQEVARIVAEIRKVMTELGYPASMTIRDMYTNLTADKQFLLKDGDEILTRYRQVIFERIKPALPQLFRDIPDLPLLVQGSVIDGIGGSYLDGSADGSRPGIFFANVHRVEDNPTFAMISLSLHEALPGHHLQFSYSKESDVPDFRKNLEWRSYNVPYFFPFYNAYTEGWALYCEYLGEEMGIYHDNYELLGRYSDEMLRACRLVIDTGIHYFNWTRDDAIEYMLNHTAMTPEATATEIDRYVTWPGQACGYKMGEIKIKELRQKASEALGDRFDVRDFHYQILANGALPLNILETVVDTWIASVSATPSTPDCKSHIVASGAAIIPVSYAFVSVAALINVYNIV